MTVLMTGYMGGNHSPYEWLTELGWTWWSWVFLRMYGNGLMALGMGWELASEKGLAQLTMFVLGCHDPIFYMTMKPEVTLYQSNKNNPHSCATVHSSRTSPALVQTFLGGSPRQKVPRAPPPSIIPS